MARSNYDVNGKTVFVTGAARGIGLDTAQRMHRRGANVVLVGLEPELLERNAAALGSRAAWFEADVTDLSALEAAVQGTLERFGGIDVTVANAGLAFVGSTLQMPVEQFERTINVNLLGAYKTLHATGPHVVERKGYLLTIASASALMHTMLMAAYSASKAGIEAACDALRVELAPTGTRVGVAYFGFIDTDLVRKSFAHRATENMRAGTPGFLNKPVPLAVAGKAIERGITTRASHVAAPAFVRWLKPWRGIAQPLADAALMRDKPKIAESVRLADRPGAGPEPSLELGIAAESADDREPVG
jgi:NAD(P)-dependent dehydrogenase (short-subunit alcohol dehydrogenase family)